MEPNPLPVALARLHPDQHRQLLDELRSQGVELRRQSARLRVIGRCSIIVAVAAVLVSFNTALSIYDRVQLARLADEMKREMQQWPGMQQAPRRGR